MKAISEKSIAAGIPVFHNHFVIEKSAKVLGNRAPIFRLLAETESIVRGTWCAAPVDGLEPKESDFILERARMSAFNGTQLDALLRGLGVETIIVTGVWTNIAVEHTCRDGADYVYNVVIATDGTSTINEEWQNAALNYAMNKQAINPYILVSHIISTHNRLKNISFYNIDCTFFLCLSKVS